MTESERIVAWAERQTGEAGPPAKRPQGRAGHLTETERQAIRLAYLESGGRVTRVALALQFNVNRDTVAACLQGPDYRALQAQFQEELQAAAVDRLKAYVGPAAEAWIDAIGIAALKGDHRAAKDLLLHTETIKPVQSGGESGITIQIGGAVDVKVGVVVSTGA